MATLNIKGKDGATKVIKLYSSAQREAWDETAAGDTSGQIAIYDGTSTLYPYTSKTKTTDATQVCSYYDKAGAQHYLYTTVPDFSKEPATSLYAGVNGPTTISPTITPNGVRIYMLGGRGRDGEDGGDGVAATEKPTASNTQTRGANGKGGAGGSGGKTGTCTIKIGDSKNYIQIYAAPGYGGGGGGGGAGGCQRYEKVIDANGGSVTRINVFPPCPGGAGGKGSRGDIIVFDYMPTEECTITAGNSAANNEYKGSNGADGTGIVADVAGSYDSSVSDFEIATSGGGYIGGYGGGTALNTTTVSPNTTTTDLAIRGKGADGRSTPDSFRLDTEEWTTEDSVYKYPVKYMNGTTYESTSLPYRRGSIALYDALMAKYATDQRNAFIVVEAL